MNCDAGRAAPRETSSTPAAAPPEHDAPALMRGGSEARIRLGDAVYTLRITRQGKLILTK